MWGKGRLLVCICGSLWIGQLEFRSVWQRNWILFRIRWVVGFVSRKNKWMVITNLFKTYRNMWTVFWYVYAKKTSAVIPRSARLTGKQSRSGNKPCTRRKIYLCDKSVGVSCEPQPWSVSLNLVALVEWLWLALALTSWIDCLDTFANHWQPQRIMFLELG